MSRYCLFKPAAQPVKRILKLSLVQAVVGGMTCSSALSWEMKADFLREYTASAMYSAVARRQIHYCLREVEKPFSRRAISRELALSLRTWSRALEQAQGFGAVSIKEVDCQAIDLTVMLDISRAQPGLHYLAYTAPVHPNLNKSFTYIHMATNVACATQTVQSSRLMPFMPVHSLSNPSPAQFRTCNSYAILLHETGHAFGLCDTYLDRPNHECAANFHFSMALNQRGKQRGKQTQASVMGGNRCLQLTTDDRAGLIAIARLMTEHQNSLRLAKQMRRAQTQRGLRPTSELLVAGNNPANVQRSRPKTGKPGN